MFFYFFLAVIHHRRRFDLACPQVFLNPAIKARHPDDKDYYQFVNDIDLPEKPYLSTKAVQIQSDLLQQVDKIFTKK